MRRIINVMLTQKLKLYNSIMNRPSRVRNFYLQFLNVNDKNAKYGIAHRAYDICQKYKYSFIKITLDPDFCKQCCKKFKLMKPDGISDSCKFLLKNPTNENFTMWKLLLKPF